MEESDPQATQAMPSDPMKTEMISHAPAGATQAITPVQCPVCKQHNPPGEMFCVECGLLFEAELAEEDLSGRPAAPLPRLVEKSSGREHPLRPGVNTIGRELTDVLLADNRVSRRHAELELTEDGARVTDVGSTNGTTIGGRRLAPNEPAEVAHGTVVSFGGVEMELSLPGLAMRTEAMPAPPKPAEPPPGRPENAVAVLVAEDGSEIAIRGEEATVGRRSGNDISITDPYVSGSHGKFVVRDGALFYTDVGSTNGSALNGEKLEPNVEAELPDGAELTIGRKTYTVLLIAKDGSGEA